VRRRSIGKSTKATSKTAQAAAATDMQRAMLNKAAGDTFQPSVVAAVYIETTKKEYYRH
jgi:hypothetical protein